MKTLATAAMAAILGGEAIVTGAAQISPRDGSPAIRVWGGHGVITLLGNPYLPLGDRGFAQTTSNAMGGVAQGITLGLSGVEDAALELLEANEVNNASVVIYRLIFASDGKNLLDTHPFDRGRGDELTVDDTVGGPAAIKFAVESSARGLGRGGARQRTDPDQRLISPTDGYFKFIDYAGEKMLYWGGKKPANAGIALVPSPPTGDA